MYGNYIERDNGTIGLLLSSCSQRDSWEKQNAIKEKTNASTFIECQTDRSS